MAKLDTLREGDALPPLEKAAIERIQLVKYAGASGDFNRIHVEEGYAQAAGYPSVFAHGMLTMGFFGQLLTDWLGGPGPIVKLGCRFKAITWPGDIVTCRAKITRVYQEQGERRLDVSLVATTGEGAVTAEGTATVRVQ